MYTYSKTALISQITSLFGGRVAEEIINGKNGITTGASNEKLKGKDLAKKRSLNGASLTNWGH
ncbi:MAG: hypothetical protein CM15mP31_5370 [Gammaproteobacteria bacterium]|nr:MAG: hypothetical protein CM15mP31_5370 [Gammaproteobacteria bacterium]